MIQLCELTHAGPPGAKVAGQSSSIWWRRCGGAWRKAWNRSRIEAAREVMFLENCRLEEIELVYEREVT